MKLVPQPSDTLTATLIRNQDGILAIKGVLNGQEGFVPLPGTSRSIAAEVAARLDNITITGAHTIEIPAWVLVLKESYEIVTPATAWEYLMAGAGAEDRAPVMSRVRSYIATMCRGDWEGVTDPICFDEKGRRINGKHRCLAVVLSGRPQVFKVVRGLPAKAQTGMDRGVGRGHADWLHHTYPDLPHKDILGPILRIIIETGTGLGSQNDHGGFLRVCEMYHEDLLWLKGVLATDAKEETPLFKKTITRASFVMAHHFQKESTEAFVKDMFRGTNNLASKLANLLSSMAEKKLPPKEVLAKILATTHRYKDGRTAGENVRLTSANFVEEVEALVGGPRALLLPEGWQDPKANKVSGSVAKTQPVEEKPQSAKSRIKKAVLPWQPLARVGPPLSP